MNPIFGINHTKIGGQMSRNDNKKIIIE
jgi:hypothetical protein